MLKKIICSLLFKKINADAKFKDMITKMFVCSLSDSERLSIIEARYKARNAPDINYHFEFDDGIDSYAISKLATKERTYKDLKDILASGGKQANVSSYSKSHL